MLSSYLRTLLYRSCGITEPKLFTGTSIGLEVVAISLKLGTGMKRRKKLPNVELQSCAVEWIPNLDTGYDLTEDADFGFHDDKNRFSFIIMNRMSRFYSKKGQLLKAWQAHISQVLHRNKLATIPHNSQMLWYDTRCLFHHVRYTTCQMLCNLWTGKSFLLSGRLGVLVLIINLNRQASSREMTTVSFTSAS